MTCLEPDHRWDDGTCRGPCTYCEQASGHGAERCPIEDGFGVYPARPVATLPSVDALTRRVDEQRIEVAKQIAAQETMNQVLRWQRDTELARRARELTRAAPQASTSAVPDPDSTMSTEHDAAEVEEARRAAKARKNKARRDRRKVAREAARDEPGQGGAEDDDLDGKPTLGEVMVKEETIIKEEE